VIEGLRPLVNAECNDGCGSKPAIVSFRPIPAISQGQRPRPNPIEVINRQLVAGRDCFDTSQYMGIEASGPPVPRRADRVALVAEVGVRRAGVKPFRVRAFDLSPAGCKIEFIEVPSVGERVWVKFDALEALEGTVRWTEGHVGGVQFERSLYEPVFRRLVG